MSYALTKGAVATMYNNPSDDHHPTLQLISLKKVKPPTVGAHPDRYRVVLSDGEQFLQGMLATQLNPLVSSGKLDKHTIIRLNKYATQVVQTRKIVICLVLDVLETLGEKIGEPVGIDPNPGANGTTSSSNVTPTTTSNPTATSTSSNTAATTATTATNNMNDNTNANISRPHVYPIEGLSPYANKWTIKARVTQKSDIRHYSSARGDGRLFNVNLLDDSGEIRATGFNETVDRFYHLLTEGDVFYISRARVNLANKKFSNLNNEYEIAFDSNTEIEKCTDTYNLPQIKYDFVELANLEKLEKDSTCDVIGVAKEIAEVSQITSKTTQKPISKREITLVDKSGYSVRLTLWNKQAEGFSASPQPILAFRNVKVGDFGGRSLSMVSSSTMMIDPDIAEAHALRGWFDSRENDSFQTFNSSTMGSTGAGFNQEQMRTLTQVRDEQLGMGDTVDYFSSRATVMFIKSDTLSYPACPADRCNKKVVMEGDEQWRCERCEAVYPAPEYRYILNLSVSDFTGQSWFSAFNDIGEMILGHTAGEMERLRNEDEDGFRQIINNAQCRMYDFVCRAKADTFNDTLRVRCQIQTATPVDWTSASKDLIQKIEQY